ncbi:MAG: hypothetical protein WCF18_11825 [Chthoniobacteraceae bacterium]
MLVVISIILLVAVVALPGINSLSKSAARRSSVSLVMAALDQARTQAVAQSATVYFVFANGDPQLAFSSEAGKPGEDYRFRAFAVFQETYIPPQPNASAEDAARPYIRLPVRPWTLLPQGVAFRPDELPREGDKIPPIKTIFSGKKDEFYCQPAKAKIQLPYIKFNATGAIEEPTEADLARVSIFEGFVDANNRAVVTNPAKAMADETITLSLFTGRAKRLEPTHAAN